jgi:outer membrane protein TolC
MAAVQTSSGPCRAIGRCWRRLRDHAERAGRSAAAAVGQLARCAAGAELPVTDWWQFQRSGSEPIGRRGAFKGPSVQLAVSRVREARALSYSTIAQFLPQLTATGSGSYQRFVEGACPRWR